MGRNLKTRKIFLKTPKILKKRIKIEKRQIFKKTRRNLKNAKNLEQNSKNLEKREKLSDLEEEVMVDNRQSYKMGLECLRDSYFTPLFAASYLDLLTNFASCVFVEGLVWRIFIW